MGNLFCKDTPDISLSCNNSGMINSCCGSTSTDAPNRDKGKIRNGEILITLEGPVCPVVALSTKSIGPLGLG